jgi:hypothetical protein
MEAGLLITQRSRVQIPPPLLVSTAQGPFSLGRGPLRITACDRSTGRCGGDELLVWDPADPGAGPVQLGRHSGRTLAVLAVLPDGRVASGGEDGVLVWDVQNGTARSLIACSAYAFATSPSPSGAYLFHRSCKRRNFMLGGARSSTEYAWNPAARGVTRCNNRG